MTRWLHMIPVSEPDVRRLRTPLPLTGTDDDLLLRLCGRTRTLPARSVVESENQPVASAFILREGWVFAYKVTPDGDRQVVDFLLPGDIIGFGGLFHHVAEQSYETITDTELVEVSAASLQRAAREAPEIVGILLALISRERANLIEHLIDVGRRSSTARVAHLLLELHRRLQLVGRASRTAYACPISQYLLADALGLTAIHVNRVLRQLRVSGLLTFRHGHVTIHDPARLIELTGFDPAYLEGSPATVAVLTRTSPPSRPMPKTSAGLTAHRG